MSRGISSFVSRNGPSTFVASASSLPSAERMRSPGNAPALLNEHVEAGLSRAAKRVAKGAHVIQITDVAPMHAHVAVARGLHDRRACVLAALPIRERAAARSLPAARTPPRLPAPAPSSPR